MNVDDDTVLGALWDRLHAANDDEPQAEAVTLTADEIRRREVAKAFDPMSQTWWSIPMALAWICSQSIDDVRDQWDAYRAKVGDAPAVWDDIFIRQAYDDAINAPRRSIPLKPAASDLQRALEDGWFTAFGLRFQDGADIELSPMLWYDMWFDAEPQLGLTCISPRTGHTYIRVRLRRADVLNFAQLLRDVIASDDDLPPPVVRSAEDNDGPSIAWKKSQLPAPARRGRRRLYDRTAFVGEVVCQLDIEGGLAPINGSSFSQSDLERRMAGWCSSNWERTPSEATIRNFVVEGIAEWTARNSG